MDACEYFGQTHGVHHGRTGLATTNGHHYERRVSKETKKSNTLDDTSLAVGIEAERFWVNSEADAIWGEIVRIADTTEPIKVPRTAEEMVVFIRDFSNWLARFPAAMCHSNNNKQEALAKDLSLAYIRRHVVRKVVLGGLPCVGVK